MITSQILYVVIISVGLVVSFFNSSEFLDTPYEYYSEASYKLVYVLVLLFTFVFLLKRKSVFYKKGYRRLSIILILCFASWVYGILIGLISGNPLVYIFSNYLFLALSLLPLVIIKIPVKYLAKFLWSVIPLIFYSSFLYISRSIVAIPSFLASANNIFNLDFNRASFQYTYISTAPFFCMVAILCLIHIIYPCRYSRFVNFLQKSSGLKGNFYRLPWILLNRNPRIFMFWFLWLGLLSYISSAYIFFFIIGAVFYSSLRCKFLVPLFIVLGISILASTFALFEVRYGLSRFNQLIEVSQLISLQGNGLGSFVAGRGTPYGTELLFLGIVAQLGLFALPFYLLLISTVFDLVVLWNRNDDFSFILSISFLFYVSSIFSNPSLGAPWAYLLVITGSFVARTCVLSPHWFESKLQ